MCTLTFPGLDEPISHRSAHFPGTRTRMAPRVHVLSQKSHSCNKDVVKCFQNTAGFLDMIPSDENTPWPTTWLSSEVKGCCYSVLPYRNIYLQEVFVMALLCFSQMFGL